ncbi:MAG TPA: TolC family protein [Candidatus Acidoferrales bacterium]|nr:TolC family protein [Candidatus Acidoferrales bacterium]
MSTDETACQRGWMAVSAGRGIAAGLLTAAFLWLSPTFGQARQQAPPAPVVQLAAPPLGNQTGPPATISLLDALDRARRNSPAFQAAVSAVKQAKLSQTQARAAMLPSLDFVTQYLNTQGNGISPVGRFVTNDGIHVYRAWGVMHQGLPSTFFIDAGPRSAAYQKALAEANEEIARRGLAVTVTLDYYGLVTAERAYAVAEKSLESARHFLATSQSLERGGEVAHVDVIRFQLEVSQRERALEDARLAMEDARLALGVLLFPTFNENFTVVDDLDTPPVLPAFKQAEAMAQTQNPQLAAAMAAYRSAGLNVSVARAAFFPSLGVDLDYGIEANAFALNSVNTTRPGVVQPNLGYFATYSLDLPIFDWGSRLSKLRQAEDQRDLERLSLSFAQRQMVSQLYSFYNEAAVAWNQLTSLRHSADLAAQNYQLVSMQYSAGTAQVLQVLDAETALDQARISFAAGEARYRNALATLQTLTGSF